MSNVKGVGSMFKDCKNLVNVDLSTWTCTKSLYLNDLFNGCTNLKHIKCNANLSNNSGFIYRIFQNIGENGVLEYNCSFNFDSIKALLPSSWTMKCLG
jgi:hypothetical protein